MRYARNTNSIGRTRHSSTIETQGSGTEIRWLRARERVFSNQNAATWFSTWPLSGSVPRTTSKALTRSVTTIVRRPSFE